jgi:flagellar hook-associated protein 3 FlgL
MAAIRVTPRLLAQRMLNNLQGQSRRMLELQEQLATGLRVNSPSQGPLATRRAISARAEMAKTEQYITNISTIGPQLLETTSTVQTMIDLVQRVRELALAGGNGTTNDAQRAAIAQEVNQLLESALSQANLQTNGRFLFGGTRTLNTPFLATRDAAGDITAVGYEGNTEAIRAEVSENVTVPVNETGFAAFLSKQDIFQTLIDVRDDLRNGNVDDLQNARLDELKTVQDQLLESLARVGAIQNRLERLSANHEDFVLHLQTVLSDAIDADFAETIVNLNSQSNALQAALNATARAIQPSLLDFVR